MDPSADDRVREMGREVREFAHLHGELARAEARAGLLRLVIGCFCLGLGVSVGGLGLLAAGFAFYLLLVRVLPPAGAAATVAFLLGAASAGSWFLAWRFLRRSSSMFLPRTRAMLGELFAWHDKPTDS